MRLHGGELVLQGTQFGVVMRRDVVMMGEMIDWAAIQ
jgi:hypothetical protein